VDADDAGIGARLRTSREAAGLSQQQLADRSGLSIRAVWNIEHGRTHWPYRDSLTRLADALGLQDGIRSEFLCAVPRRRLARQIPATGLAKVLIVPRQLPASVRQFVGRERELAELTGLLGQAGARPAAEFVGRQGELAALTGLLDQTGSPPAVVISAIGGTAGVGKTALAVHWAHQVASRFPDGQLYVNLRGFHHSGKPMSSAGAIRGLLDALQVPAVQIPASLDAQAGLYRSLLAERRMLVVLDNARDAGQVRPLLPGSPGCLVVVTSRSQLAGLAATDGAFQLTLDLLTEAEARQLLARRLGAARLAQEPEAVAELIALCARLPLALAIVAARASGRPKLRLGALAEDLKDAPRRLDTLDTGDAAASVRPVFSWSLDSLSAPAARLFALLGVHPGPDVTIEAAASLAGIPLPQARRAVLELARAHLITEHVPGRYSLHDLLRAYAAELAAGQEPEVERRAAVGRVLDYYLHTAKTAALLLDPSREPLALAPPGSGVTPDSLADSQQALAWFKAEHQVLIAAVTLAAESGFGVWAWQLPWALTDYLDWHGHWHEFAAIQRTALAAVTRRGDTAGQAVARRLLARAQARLGDYGQARAHLTHCLRFYRQLGDSFGEARVHQSLGGVAMYQGRHAGALAHAEQALALFRAAGHRAGQAGSLSNAGWCHALLGDYQLARKFCWQALAMNRELGDRSGEAGCWDILGYAEHKLGNLTEAGDYLRRALGIFRELGDRYEQAEILTHLGDVHLTAGNRPAAAHAWQQALVLLDDLHHPDAAQLRARLTRPGTGQHSPKAQGITGRTKADLPDM
jgi:tetratricopeptide (TPR) repeat protein/transcriptional regulator with XRE-family HTH domain